MSDTVPAEEQRQVRKCDHCGQEDDHPHHIQYASVTYTNPITNEVKVEDLSVSRHMDCCNCDHCEIVLSTANGAHGLDLVAHISSKPTELHQKLRDAGYDVED